MSWVARPGTFFEPYDHAKAILDYRTGYFSTSILSINRNVWTSHGRLQSGCFLIQSKRPQPRCLLPVTLSFGFIRHLSPFVNLRPLHLLEQCLGPGSMVSIMDHFSSCSADSIQVVRPAWTTDNYKHSYEELGPFVGAN
jgi:hypothetical protein